MQSCAQSKWIYYNDEEHKFIGYKFIDADRFSKEIDEERTKEIRAWIKENRSSLVPEYQKIKGKPDNLYYELKIDSQRFLKYSLFINKQIEELGVGDLMRLFHRRMEVLIII